MSEPMRCAICKIHFKSKSEINEHMAEKHPNVRLPVWPPETKLANGCLPGGKQLYTIWDIPGCSEILHKVVRSCTIKEAVEESLYALRDQYGGMIDVGKARVHMAFLDGPDTSNDVIRFMSTRFRSRN